MKYYKLDYYVDKLKRGEKFSLARYGDGELLCMWGRHGGNSNGCRYSPELRQALLDSMVPRENFIHGLQRVLPKDEQRIMFEYPSIDWHDTEFLSEAVANGELFPLIEQLRKMKTVSIYKRDITKILPDNRSVIVPPCNTYDIREDVLKEIHGADVYLFSCGMAANALISELHGKVDAWLIDVGHIWDGFFGEMSRCDLEGKSIEEINRNLHEKTT
jgi:hypothetical protein